MASLLGCLVLILVVIIDTSILAQGFEQNLSNALLRKILYFRNRLESTVQCGLEGCFVRKENTHPRLIRN